MIPRHVQQTTRSRSKRSPLGDHCGEILNKPQTKIKMRTTLQRGGARCVICRNGRRNSLIIQWAMRLLYQVTHPEAFLVDRILRHLQEKWYRSLHRIFDSLPERLILRSVEDQKCRRALCIRRIGDQVYLVQKEFGDLNDSRSQSYRRLRISKQSTVC